MLNEGNLNTGDIILLNYYRGIVPYKLILINNKNKLMEIDSGVCNGFDLEFDSSLDPKEKYTILADYCKNIRMPLTIKNIISKEYQIGLRQYLSYIIEEVADKPSDYDLKFNGGISWDLKTSDWYREQNQWIENRKQTI